MLQAVVGARRAAELFYTAEWIDAARALEVGIAARVFPDEQVLAAALAKAREIAKHPCRRCAPRSDAEARARGRLRAALEAEDAGMKAQAGSPENMEAVRAFLEKRPPDFRKLRRG